MKASFSVGFVKVFKHLPERDAQIINSKLDAFLSNDENVDVKKMRPNHLGYYRLRAGRYRLIFEYTDSEEVCFLKLDARDKIYK